MKTALRFFTVGILLTGIAADAEQPAMPATAQELTELLEKRWSLKAIEDFCTPEHRWNPLNQNLVPDGDKYWEGVLYEGKPKTFDKIYWYAGVRQNKIEYSLNAARGKDRWCLEI